MTISFCVKCKNILPPGNSEGDFIIECPTCGFRQKNDSRLISTEFSPEKTEKGQGVGTDENIYATYEHECKKCGYGMAQVIDMGIKYSDEDNLIFLRCGKCGFSERVGRKVS